MPELKLAAFSLVTFLLLLVRTLVPCISQIVLPRDLKIIFTRRVSDIVQANYYPDLAVQWRNTLTVLGNWSDVDYTSGCTARRANWPAQEHWHRIITMATLWKQNQLDSILLEQISKAMDHWFNNDFPEEHCITAGGVKSLQCPCGTPGFWNTNWYGQMILIPTLLGKACLLLKPNLSLTQTANCTAQLSRSYARIDGDPNRRLGRMTGANALDVSSIGLTVALLTLNTTTLEGAVGRSYKEARLTSGSREGIKVDGSFMQHGSQLYTGNYGAVFIRALIRIFMETRNTTLSPPLFVQSAFLTLLRAMEWFVVNNNGSLNWQYSVVGRMISHKYEDWNGIGINLDDLLEATKAWANHAAFKEIVDRLRATKGEGPLSGAKYFHTSYYLVHRGKNYTVTLKMYSSRTKNSECCNKQNPFGFHLSDGAIFTYNRGDKYRDVFGAWDWNLIPGTTVDYGRTRLDCKHVKFSGMESFVGGVALGGAGIAVMNYTNPRTRSLRWSKAYFFFPSTYAVHFVGKIRSRKPALIVTTLDQSQRSGPIYLDGKLVTKGLVTKRAETLWHDRVGYKLSSQAKLTVDTRPQRSDWAAIGISKGNETQNLFAGYISHTVDNMAEFSYFVHLGVEQSEFAKGFKSKISGFILNQNSRKTSSAIAKGAYYGDAGSPGERYVCLSFWTSGNFETGLEDIKKVWTDAPLLLLFQRRENSTSWTLTVSDPSQRLRTVNIQVSIENTRSPFSFKVDLPTGTWAGSAHVISINSNIIK